MHNRNRIAKLLLIIPILGSAVGCGASSTEIPTDISRITSGDEKATWTEYEVPTQIPNILVDQVGYVSSSEKAVIFRGEKLPDEFYICREDDGEIVYTGEIMRQGVNENLSEYDSQGFFNDFKQPGSYYIYADVLGESFSFNIADNIYEEVLTEACKKYYVNRCGIALSESYAGEGARSACHTTMARLQESPETQIDVSGGWHLDGDALRNTAYGSKTAEDILLAYELNPGAFSDDTGIPESGNSVPDILDEVRYEIEWLLKMQDPKTGGEYGAAVVEPSGGGDIFSSPVYVTPIDLESTISFASVAARFSYMYRQYDSDFATSCLKAADRAWSCYLNNQSPDESSAAFKAAAQLYRATGAETYHNVLKEFFNRKDFKELFNTDKNAFVGAVTYLSINQNVDMEICTAVMKLLMKRAEDVAARASKNSYLVTTETVDNGFEKLLDDMMCLTITDHIIYNHEYTTIIENHAHFLMGMNPDAINYATRDTERTYISCGTNGVMSDPGIDALFIFMLSVLVR